MLPELEVITGDLLEQEVEAIVNPWNRNLIPWWLLLPQGVSGAIKKKAGYGPFKELTKHGTLALGEAVLTQAGKLPFKAIIHVAGIGHTWTSNEKSIRGSVRNALILAEKHQLRTIAFPLIGAGTGGGTPDKVTAFICDEIKASSYQGKTIVVVFKAPSK